MKYTVTWKPDAESELMNLWLGASNRESIRQAADDIERLLANDAEDQGKSRIGDFRILLIEPIGVLYHVSHLDRRVAVVRVWVTS
jgi:hypothetical protein